MTVSVTTVNYFVLWQVIWGSSVYPYYWKLWMKRYKLCFWRTVPNSGATIYRAPPIFPSLKMRATLQKNQTYCSTCNHGHAGKATLDTPSFRPFFPLRFITRLCLPHSAGQKSTAPLPTSKTPAATSLVWYTGGLSRPMLKHNHRLWLSVTWRFYQEGSN